MSDWDEIEEQYCPTDGTDAKIPKIRKARYHRVTLKNGYEFEIGWSFIMGRFVGVYVFPVVEHDDGHWDNNRQVAIGKTVKEVIGQIRRMIAERMNPDLKKVRERITGEDDPGTITFAKIQEMQKKFNSHGTVPGSIFINEKMMNELERIAAIDGNQGNVMGGPNKIFGKDVVVIPDWATKPMKSLKFKGKK